MARLDWVASVGCEGGPIMVADLPSFTKWTGAAPYTALRAANPKFIEATKDKIRTLHYWGQFSDQLPEPFRAEGGHQFIELATEAEAIAKLDELCVTIKAALPTVEITRDDEQTHFLLPGGDGDDDLEMHAELSPKSEYDASWQAHEGEECWTHAFRDAASGLFWEMEGSGVAEVGVSSDASELVMLRTWIDEDVSEQTAQAHVDARRDDEVEGPELTIASGKAIVAWSPIAPFDLAGIANPEALLALADTGPAELATQTMGGIGAVVRVKPGRYHVTHGAYETPDDVEPSWSCRWCRLTLVG